MSEKIEHIGKDLPSQSLEETNLFENLDFDSKNNEKLAFDLFENGFVNEGVDILLEYSPEKLNSISVVQAIDSVIEEKPLDAYEALVKWLNLANKEKFSSLFNFSVYLKEHFGVDLNREKDMPSLKEMLNRLYDNILKQYGVQQIDALKKIMSFKVEMLFEKQKFTIEDESDSKEFVEELVVRFFFSDPNCYAVSSDGFISLNNSYGGIYEKYKNQYKHDCKESEYFFSDRAYELFEICKLSDQDVLKYFKNEFFCMSGFGLNSRQDKVSRKKAILERYDLFLDKKITKSDDTTFRKLSDEIDLNSNQSGLQWK
jgi:hypothetical protein